MLREPAPAAIYREMAVLATLLAAFSLLAAAEEPAFDPSRYPE